MHTLQAAVVTGQARELNCSAQAHQACHSAVTMEIQYNVHKFTNTKVLFNINKITGKALSYNR